MTIAGWIVGGDLAYSYLGSQVTLLFGRQSADLILEAMRSARTSDGAAATLLSALMLLIGASTVFAALESALRQVWGGPRVYAPRLARIRARPADFLRVHLAIGFLLLVSLTLTTALRAARLRPAALRRDDWPARIARLPAVRGARYRAWWR